MNDFTNLPLTTEVAAGLAGLAFSAFMRYAPKVDVWFEALETWQKQLIVLLFSVAAPFLILAGACVNLWTSTATCDQAGVLVAIRIALVFLLSSQAGHLTFPKRESVVAAAKNERFARQFDLVNVPGDGIVKLEVITPGVEIHGDVIKPVGAERKADDQAAAG